jgi:hypothetical protein
MARFRRQRGAKRAEAHPDGQIRQSQVVTTFGPGALVDLLDQAVLIGGLEFWKYSREQPAKIIAEPRLRERIVEAYDIDLSPEAPFRTPPVGKDDEPTPFSGIRALEFPAWFVCQQCRALVRGIDGTTVKGRRRVHDCAGSRRAGACVPVRFVAACRRGHLQDFPWRRWLHIGSPCRGGTMHLHEGRTGDFSEIRVACDCGVPPRKLADANIEAMRPSCDGHRPWLGRESGEGCSEALRLLVRTASNNYFPQVLSALSMPDPDRELDDAVHRIWSSVERVSGAEQVALLRDMQPRVFQHLGNFSDAEIAEAVARKKSGHKLTIAPLRVTEYRKLLAAVPDPEHPEDADFIAELCPRPPALPPSIERVVLVHKVREVRAQIGFTRLEPATMDQHGEFEHDLGVQRSSLSLTESWLPAAEVRGEGVFLVLDEDALREWESRDAVRARGKELAAGYQQWARSHRLGEPPPFLGVRFYLLHTLAHLLVTSISLECGYAASAIRERLYSWRTDDEGELNMAGILLSTGTTGSEGTLGGLVDQGRRLAHHLANALEMGTLCSNDPVCATHSPNGDPSERFLEGAACHGCLFVAECSCERFNRYLDRALVVPTMGHPADLAFFRAAGAGSLDGSR